MNMKIRLRRLKQNKKEWNENVQKNVGYISLWLWCIICVCRSHVVAVFKRAMGFCFFHPHNSTNETKSTNAKFRENNVVFIPCFLMINTWQQRKLINKPHSINVYKLVYKIMLNLKHKQHLLFITRGNIDINLDVNAETQWN